jgi:hypothetical protein
MLFSAVFQDFATAAKTTRYGLIQPVRGTSRACRSVIHSRAYRCFAGTVAANPAGSDRGKKIMAGKLDDLYAEGVGRRNRLMPTIPNFDPDRETANFAEWDNRVLALLNADCISIAERSSFRTLNLFHPISAQVPDKSPPQHHLEAMWTEKLERLKLIIHRIGH